jgi:hypothetical protein
MQHRTAALVDQVILWTLGPFSNLLLRVFSAYSWGRDWIFDEVEFFLHPFLAHLI